MEKNDITLGLISGGGCGGGSCPAIYKDSTGKIYIQGTKMGDELRKLTNIFSEEDIVELHPDMLEALKSL